MNSLKHDARVAGLIYLSMVVTGPFALMYVPDKLIVRGNAAATAGNVLAHETMFRMSIVADLFGSLLFIALGLALYRLLSGVNRKHAAVMLILVLVSAAFGFANQIFNLGALTAFKGGEYFAVFEKPQREAIGMLLLRMHSQGIVIDEILWGLWLLPFGVLVMRSGFLPRVLGIWLIVNCFGWVALSLTGLFVPGYTALVYKAIMPATLGEIGIALWLAIMGAKTPAVAAAAA